MKHWSLFIAWVAGQVASAVLGIPIFWPLAIGVGGVLLFLATVNSLKDASAKVVEAVKPFSIEPTAEDKALALEMYQSGIRESYVAPSGAIVDVAAIGDKFEEGKRQNERVYRAARAKALRFAGYDEFCCDECDADDLLNYEGFKKKWRDQKVMVPTGASVNQKTNEAKLNYNVYSVRQLGNIYVGLVNGVVEFQTFDSDEAQSWLRDATALSQKLGLNSSNIARWLDD